MVTIVPAGEGSVMSRSPGRGGGVKSGMAGSTGEGGGMRVLLSGSKRSGFAPDTTSVEETTAGPPGMATGVDWVKVAVATPHPAGVEGTTLLWIGPAATELPAYGPSTSPGSSPPSCLPSWA